MEPRGVVKAINTILSSCHSKSDLQHSKLVGQFTVQIKAYEEHAKALERQCKETSQECAEMENQRIQLLAKEREDIQEYNQLIKRVEELRELISLDPTKSRWLTITQPQESTHDTSLIERLQIEIPQITRNYNEKSAQLRDVRAKNKELETLLTELNTQNRMLKQQVQHAKLRIQSKEDTIVQIAGLIQTLIKSNSALQMESEQLEKQFDSELQHLGLSRADYERYSKAGEQIQQLENERNRLIKKHEELQKEREIIGNKRITTAQELAECQGKAETLQQMCREKREIKNKTNESDSSLVGRLKRRLVELQHETEELKRTKLSKAPIHV